MKVKTPYNLVIAPYADNPFEWGKTTRPKGDKKYKNLFILPKNFYFAEMDKLINFAALFLWDLFRGQIIDKELSKKEYTQLKLTPKGIEFINKKTQGKLFIPFYVTQKSSILTELNETLDFEPFALTFKARVGQGIFMKADLFICLAGNYPKKEMNGKHFFNIPAFVKNNSQDAISQDAQELDKLKNNYSIEFIDKAYCQKLLLSEDTPIFMNCNSAWQKSSPPNPEDEGTEYANS